VTRTESDITLLAQAMGSDDRLRGQLAEELDDVARRFNAELVSDLVCVNQLVTHIEQYRGKMLRPTLLLACGHVCADGRPPVSEAHRVLATVVEMVHMATLVHDDILDEARMRRGGQTVNVLRGNETAVILGDYLISHAYHLCSSFDDPELSRAVAATTNVVCEGELLQLSNRKQWELEERTYYEIIRRKTASLTALACRLGARLHEARQPLVEAMAEYGEKTGMAFQIIDDLFDLLGREDTIGKTLRSDLHKGKATLPIIHCLATLPAGSKRKQLLKWLDELVRTSEAAPPGDGFDPRVAREQLSRVRDCVESTGSVDYARRQAQRLIDDARRAADRLPASPARELLHEMAEAVMTRRF